MLLFLRYFTSLSKAIWHYYAYTIFYVITLFYVILRYFALLYVIILFDVILRENVIYVILCDLTSYVAYVKILRYFTF